MQEYAPCCTFSDPNTSSRRLYEWLGVMLPGNQRRLCSRFRRWAPGQWLGQMNNQELSDRRSSDRAETKPSGPTQSYATPNREMPVHPSRTTRPAWPRSAPQQPARSACGPCLTLERLTDCGGRRWRHRRRTCGRGVRTAPAHPRAPATAAASCRPRGAAARSAQGKLESSAGATASGRTLTSHMQH